MADGSMAQFIESSRLLIENAQVLPEVAAVLAGYGYDAARLEEGSRLWSKAEALVRKQAREYGERHQATAEVEAARAELVSTYMKTLKVARVAFADDILAADALKLYGPRKQSLSGWLDQVSTFYSNLRTGSRLAPKMLRFGYGLERLQAEASLVDELRRKIQAQAKESGEAQCATVERDRKLRELDTWVSELSAIARVAFHGSPQELEKLGLLVPSAPRRRKASAPTSEMAAKK
jgi:hypothetical protein